jgi:hypothetical protein
MDRCLFNRFRSRFGAVKQTMGLAPRFICGTITSVSGPARHKLWWFRAGDSRAAGRASLWISGTSVAAAKKARDPDLFPSYD